MQTTLEIAMREVGRAYNEETRNLNFLSTVELTVKDAIKVLKRHVPSYNEFKPSLPSCRMILWCVLAARVRRLSM